MKIAVIAGTPVDTKMGRVVLEKAGYSNVTELAVSNNPVEQTIFQTSSQKEKEKLIINFLEKLEEKKYTYLFVYCNSLSSAVDFEKISKNYKIKVVTPLQIYKKLATKYKNIVVLSANAQGLAGIERVMMNTNKELNILGITLLSLVEAIELNKKPETIALEFNFENLANYLLNFTNFDMCLLGCTHFPYIKKELSKYLTIKIIDPTEAMLLELKKG